MGYRNYVGKIKKEINKDYEVILKDEYDWLGCYDLVDTIYNFGKGCDFDIKEHLSDYFEKEKTNLHFNQDYEFKQITKEGFEKIINKYKEFILSYYEELKEEDYKEHVKRAISEWKYPVIVNLRDGDMLTGSWLYEYAIFDLVRIYKTFDWENDIMIWYGY